MLDAIVSSDEPSNSHEQAVRAAFELGMATAEYRVLHFFEDYVTAGMALEQWREEGLPKARAERLRQGMRTRPAILKAANGLYSKSPLLFCNDSKPLALSSNCGCRICKKVTARRWGSTRLHVICVSPGRGLRVIEKQVPFGLPRISRESDFWRRTPLRRFERLRSQLACRLGAQASCTREFSRFRISENPL